MKLCGIDQKSIIIDKNMFNLKSKMHIDNSYDIRAYYCNSIDSDIYSCNDSIEFKSKTIVQRIGERILDGSENWSYDPVTKTYYYHQDNKFHIPCGGFFDTMLCTHFTWRQYSLTPPYGTIQGGEENEIMFNYDFGNGGVDNFINWLQSQIDKNIPVKVQYVLQEPLIGHIDLPNPMPRFLPRNYFIESHGGVEPIINTHTSIINRPY